MMPTSDQIGGVVRGLLVAVGFIGGLIGIVPADKWAEISAQISGPLTTLLGSALALGMIWWSWRTNSTKAMVQSVSEKPEVKLVVSPKLALETPDHPKVVAQ